MYKSGAETQILALTFASTVRLSLRGSAAKAETGNMTHSKAESYQSHFMRMVEREVPCLTRTRLPAPIYSLPNIVAHRYGSNRFFQRVR